jgi:hypothetical protein
MTTQAAHPNDAVKLLLDCFEKLKGANAVPDDYLEAIRLASLPLSPVAIVSRMEHVALRNGPEWKPTRLRYFKAPINDLLTEPHAAQSAQPATMPTWQPAEPEVSLPEEERKQQAERLRQLTREKLNHGR